MALGAGKLKALQGSLQRMKSKGGKLKALVERDAPSKQPSAEKDADKASYFKAHKEGPENLSREELHAAARHARNTGDNDSHQKFSDAAKSAKPSGNPVQIQQQRKENKNQYERAHREGPESMTREDLHKAAEHARWIADEDSHQKFSDAAKVAPSAKGVAKEMRRDAQGKQPTQQGKRGGRFYVTASGRKVYIR